MIQCEVRIVYIQYLVPDSCQGTFSNRARVAQPEDAAVVVRGGGGGPPRGGAPDGGDPATDALSAFST